jgi:hypothetical protein
MVTFLELSFLTLETDEEHCPGGTWIAVKIYESEFAHIGRKSGAKFYLG